MGPNLRVSTRRCKTAAREQSEFPEGLCSGKEPDGFCRGRSRDCRPLGSGATDIQRATRPYVIGLTGNIGTGKSTVAHMLAQLGAQAIDADRVARELLAQGTTTWRAVLGEFGSAILREDSTIDRARLGDLVFSDPQALARLEAILHPGVIQEVNHRIGASHAPVVVVEAIKLIETGMHERYDALWVVTCRPKQQVARLVAQRGMSEEQILRRTRAQSPQSEKAALADVVIDNSRSLSDTRAQVRRAWHALVRS